MELYSQSLIMWFDDVILDDTDYELDMIICKTIKGKGIKFMQNDPIWHVKKLENIDDIQIAKKDLENYE